MTAPLAPRQLTIRLVVDGERIVSAGLDRRTFDVSRALVGRAPSEIPFVAAALLPVCAAAHRAASSGALEAAAGLPSRDAKARSVAVLSERIANGVWRLGLDAAGALGLPARASVVLSAREAAKALNCDPVPDAALRALEHSVDQVVDVGERLAEAASVLTPADAGPFSHRVKVAASFADQVAHAMNDPREALHDLKAILSGERDPGTHAGRDGEVMTSRGLLIHRCTMSGGAVTAWSIETPTDRIAAPDGPLARALAGLPHGGEPKRLARLVAVLHDPCEQVSIDVAEMADA